ncbi:MAG: hypothetical protein KZQ77_08955 [Candidatus Thiodiazotropha sp. (ex Notomyrtea botanica)]|nr:hypothetical protein [Candidatus Thiodiazotropha sp. (ex Notomyrtea botanica)]
MKLSILPLFVMFIFLFCMVITRKARMNASISVAEERSVYILLFMFLAWTMIVIVMGLQGTHIEFMQKIPFLWQAFVPVIMWGTAFLLSSSLRNGLFGIATSTPLYWLVFFQALRLGALGGVIKGVQGEITSDYVFWIGIPDFIFGLSALIIGLALLRKKISFRFLIIWNILGFSLIFFPTFVVMNYWMNEPGFVFIFEYPMVLAPSVVVPMFISINLLHAWGMLEKEKRSKVAECE